MTHSDALSLIYARSLYDLAEEAGGRDKIIEVSEELEQICELARSDRTLREFFASPIIDPSRRSESLRRIFNDRITDLTLRFLLVLNKKGRLAHLEAINSTFDHLLQEAFGQVEVDVFTPGPLGDEQANAIKSRIKKALSKEAVLHHYTEPAMLGGLKLRIGDQLIDGSVATKLKRLKHNLTISGPTKMRTRMDRIIEEGEA